jgi:methionine-rich copper-binding protein CopC
MHTTQVTLNPMERKGSTMMRFILATLLGAVFLAALPGYAAAHAFLDHSQPGADAVLASPPASVQLWFSRAMEPSFSTVRVVDQNGKQVDNGKPAVNGKDPKLLEIGLQPLAAGTYKVIWRIVALDGHKAKGDFKFTVR